MADSSMIYEDIDAFIDILTPLLVDTNIVSDIGHLAVLPGKSPPYVIIVDISRLPTYAFGGVEKFVEGIYSFRVVAKNSNTATAQQTIRKIHDIIYKNIHNQKISAGDYGSMVVKKGQVEASYKDDVDSTNRYYYCNVRYSAKFSNE